ncbi:MAG: T9SS type A sorting domain-containing protein, partial [Bacteroidales bacterium]|nr:T9SS type A sorting domain-containing protein [Bacteroidales bacterium]
EEEDNGINIYPNPTDGELTIEISDYRGEVQVSVIDNSGKLCAVISKYITESDRKIDYSLDDKRSGTYLFVIKEDKRSYIKKVIVK